MAPKANCEPQRFIKECRLEAASDKEVGNILLAGDVFKDVKRVDVVGTSKGRGTAGAMKRHGFHGLPASHGVKKHHRSPGSIGSHASNRGSGRPKLGHKGPGRYGNTRVTVRKASGETKTETVGSIFWSNDAVALATITKDTKTAGRNLCAECGRPGSLVYDMEDGLMKHYRCCDMPG